MASFNPHVGTATAGYTALAPITASGFLDSLVADLGAGVNGWSLHDDLRTSGSSYPLVFPLYTAGGVLRQYFATGNSYNFVNGSSQFVAYVPYGYSIPYSISMQSGSPTPISADGVTWYNAYYSGWVGNWQTGTLSSPWSGATTSYRALYRKITKYIVLKQTSAVKTFYVLIATPQECVGAPYIHVQVYETWNALTHQGTYPSAVEAIKLWLEGGSLQPATMRYIAWFLPEVFALYAVGDQNWGMTVDGGRFMYVGNLDTTGMRTNDTDALCFISGDTTLSGYAVDPSIAEFTVGTPTVWLGPVQCLRTILGHTWSMPSYNGGFYGANQYHPIPRGRWYGQYQGFPVLDMAGRFEVCDVDLWNVANMNGFQTWGLQAEGRRGKLRYVKLPVSNPSHMNLMTMGPAADGIVYIVLKQGPAYKTTVAQIAAAQTDAVIMGSPSWLATGWGSCFPNGLQHGEILTVQTNNGSQYQHILMPISI